MSVLRPRAGWVLVPKEPTREMLRAAAGAMSPGTRPTEQWVSNAEKHRIRYMAMIAAAPPHSKEAQMRKHFYVPRWLGPFAPLWRRLFLPRNAILVRQATGED